MALDSSEVKRLSQHISEIGARIWQRGLVASNDGNISVRLPGDLVLCTPSQVSKGFMAPEDMVVCDLKGNLVYGKRPPTSEIRMHIAAYTTRPDIKAVVHTHAPHAIAASLTFDELPQGLIAEIELTLGAIPIAEYVLPGTWDFADSLRPYFYGNEAVILRHHGLVTVGEDIDQAYLRTESVEHYCRILHISKLWGANKRLTSQQVEELRNAGSGLKSGGANSREEQLVEELASRVRRRLGL